MPEATTLRNVALYVHDRVCVGARASQPYCSRLDHVRLFRDIAHQLAGARSRRELATIMHHEYCPAWVEGRSHAHFTARSHERCGEGGERHIEAIVDSVQVKELAELIGICEE